MKTLMVAGGQPADWPVLAQDYQRYVGVDRGSLYLLEAGLPLDMAVGDFDSLQEKERQRVFAEAGSVSQSPAEKDDTDTQLALEKIFALDPAAEVTIIGATGGRLDHLLANLWLGLEPRFQPFLRQFRLLDRQNSVNFYGPGTYQVQPEAGMTYLAFCTLTSVAALTLTDVKYELNRQPVPQPTSYASNEFLPGIPATFSFTNGLIAVIQSRDA